MYNADQTLIDRFYNNIQTEANNNDPRPLVYITRNKTAITSQRYWERQQITGIVGSRSSIAVRRPEGAMLADMIFTAQVEHGDAIIRYAEPRTKLTDMEWTELTVIENVSELSIMFDGYMKKVDGTVEAYTIGELPYVFYVDVSGSLKFINLDDEDVQGTISENAINVASVRGLYSQAADLDDGIFVFYTDSSGKLWEARVLDGEVVELIEVTLKPEGGGEGEPISYGENIIPQMTSNTAPSGVASASTEFSATYRAWTAMDRNASTYWSNTANSMPAQLAYEFTTAKRIGKYKITARADASDGAPKTWTLEGWTGTEWVVLDTRTNETFTNGQTKEYIFSNAASYIRYQLSISANNGRSTTNIAGFELIEVFGDGGGSSVTAWLDVWASLTPDYRVALQLKGNDGVVYTLMSASRPSGFVLVEYFNNSLKVTNKLMFQCGEEPPIMQAIYNTPQQPLIVKISFSDTVTLFDRSPRLVWLEGSDGRKVYPLSVTKTGGKEITLMFGQDLIGLRYPQQLKDNPYKPLGFGSNGVSATIAVSPILFNVDFLHAGSDIFDNTLKVVEPLRMTVSEAFDGKAYLPDETFVNSLSVVTPLEMDVLDVDFRQAYLLDETFVNSLEIKSPLTWQFLNADGTPV